MGPLPTMREGTVGPHFPMEVEIQASAACFQSQHPRRPSFSPRPGPPAHRYAFPLLHWVNDDSKGLSLSLSLALLQLQGCKVG